MSDFTRTAAFQSNPALREALAEHRHICVLQHLNRQEEAAVQAEKLDILLEQIKSEALSGPDELSAALDAERQRVDDAALLASLLAPLLAVQSGAHTRALQSANSALHKPISPPHPRPASPENIAGFIDEMLTRQHSSGSSR